MYTPHYIDSLGHVYGYKPEHIEVKEMSEEQFESFKLQQDEESRENQEKYNLAKDLKKVRDEISTLEDIEDRSITEEERLLELKSLSTSLYRDIQIRERDQKK